VRQPSAPGPRGPRAGAMALKGHSFKMLAPKDIADVMNILGAHPTVTSEAIDKPTPEIVQSCVQALIQFAYDADLPEVKAHAHGILQRHGDQHADVYDEVLDVVCLFRTSKQLLAINRVEDYSLKDMWEPHPKRFRMMLSAMINFCRYKENKCAIITGMKDALQGLDAERMEHLDIAKDMDQSLFAAQEKHKQELQDIRDAEMEVQRVQAEVDKLQKARQSADRVVEEAESALAAAKEWTRQHEEQREQTREQVVQLQGQIAESPEGIEQEIREAQEAVREERRRLEDRSNEKRSRTQRVQVLGRLEEQLDTVRDGQMQLAQTVEACAAARDRSGRARDDLAQARRSQEAQGAEEADLEQRVHQISAEYERAKQAHEDRVQAFEERRQRALVQHQQLQEKRTEEQKQQHLLQTQRLKLEEELASARRAHEAELEKLHERQAALHRRAELYMQHVSNLLAQRSDEQLAISEGAAPDVVGAGKRELSPDAAPLRHRLVCSPSPGRVSSNPLGFLSSPGPQC